MRGKSCAGRGTLPGDTRKRTGSDRTCDHWLNLWAYGTSPHGLGLTERVFWLLTPREFEALRTVEQARAWRWAESQALRINLKLREGAEPFTAADFMGEGDREEREKQRQAGVVKVMELRRSLKSIKPGAPVPDDLPAWARGPSSVPQPIRKAS